MLRSQFKKYGLILVGLNFFSIQNLFAVGLEPGSFSLSQEVGESRLKFSIEQGEYSPELFDGATKVQVEPGSFKTYSQTVLTFTDAKGVVVARAYQDFFTSLNTITLKNSKGDVIAKLAETTHPKSTKIQYLSTLEEDGQELKGYRSISPQGRVNLHFKRTSNNVRRKEPLIVRVEESFGTTKNLKWNADVLESTTIHPLLLISTMVLDSQHQFVGFYTDIGKKLGIAVAVLATVYGGYKFYKWYDARRALQLLKKAQKANEQRKAERLETERKFDEMLVDNPKEAYDLKLKQTETASGEELLDTLEKEVRNLTKTVLEIRAQAPQQATPLLLQGDQQADTQLQAPTADQAAAEERLKAQVGFVKKLYNRSIDAILDRVGGNNQMMRHAIGPVLESIAKIKANEEDTNVDMIIGAAGKINAIHHDIASIELTQEQMIDRIIQRVDPAALTEQAFTVIDEFMMSGTQRAQAMLSNLADQMGWQHIQVAAQRNEQGDFQAGIQIIARRDDNENPAIEHNGNAIHQEERLPLIKEEEVDEEIDTDDLKRL